MFARFDGGSLYGFLTQTLGVALLRSEMAVTAVSATAQQSRLLGVKAGAPLLLMREVHFGAGDRRVLYSVNYHNSAVIDLTLVRSGVRHMSGGFASLGNMSIDDLVFVDGTTQWAVPGGNAVYAALGMAVWGERPTRHRPFGPDYPAESLEGRHRALALPQHPATLRDWGLYEEDGSRQFMFRSHTRNWDDFSPRASDVVRRASRPPISRPCPGTGTSISSRRCARADRRLSRSISMTGSWPAWSPRRGATDGQRRSVPAEPPGRPRPLSRPSPDDTVRRLRDLSPETPLIALKCGADGCVAHAAGSRDLIAPAGLSGAGRGRDGRRRHLLRRHARRLCPHPRSARALLHGAVSASFCVETVGCAGLLASTKDIAASRLAQILHKAVDLKAA